MTASSAAGSASGKRPTTIRLGRAKSATAVPWRRNSGLVKTRAVGSPVASIERRVPPTGSVLRMTRMSSGPNPSRIASSALSSWLRSLAPSSSMGVPTQTRSIPGPRRSRRVDRQPAGRDGRVERLLEARLVDRDAAGAKHAEPCRPGLDEADGVAEPGQADRADETDVAGADDGDERAA